MQSPKIHIQFASVPDSTVPWTVLFSERTQQQVIQIIILKHCSDSSYSVIKSIENVISKHEPHW